jgi:hypothetical protein
MQDELEGLTEGSGSLQLGGVADSPKFGSHQLPRLDLRHAGHRTHWSSMTHVNSLRRGEDEI